ncbi:MAG TPA: sigma-70 family RNA polymerase sigma factor [Polyangiaceae bacterium]|nr:sigma-70 family RNA polymerase sigma factor [Polyangiaceae bacterium]
MNDDRQPDRGLRAGEPIAELALHFTATYRKERGRVLSLVRRLGVPSADIEDAVQDVFMALHARFHQLDRGAGLHLWLAAAALRVCSNRRRSVLRRSANLRLDGELQVEDVVDSRQMLPDERSADNERRRLLARAIGRLDANRQQVFVLAELEEHTAEEIAKLTCVSRNTVSSRLRIARQRVASTLRGFD